MSYYLEETVNEIKALDRNDPEWGHYVACIIKKHTHGQKLGVYSTIFRELKHGPRKPRFFKRHVKWMVRDWLKYKVMTHEDFANRPIRNQIYGMFDWKKTPSTTIYRACPYNKEMRCGSTSDDDCVNCDNNPEIIEKTYKEWKEKYYKEAA